MVLAEMIQVGCRHGRYGAVQEPAAEGRLRRCHGGFEACGVTNAVNAPVRLNLLFVNFQDFVKG